MIGWLIELIAKIIFYIALVIFLGIVLIIMIAYVGIIFGLFIAFFPWSLIILLFMWR